MNRIFFYILTLVIFSCSQNERTTFNDQVSKAIEIVSSSVVGININSINNNEYYGSGLIISEDGYIVTNSHVVKYSKEILVTTSGGKKYYAEIIGTDELTDLALLKIIEKGLPFIDLDSSINLTQGEWVVAIGNPYNLFSASNEATATIGIISGKNINFGLQGEGHVYQNMIQTDASINPGNSGGPLVNMEGKIIGINTFIINESKASSGIGFSIPIKRVVDIVDELKIHGKVDRKWITGITVRAIDEKFRNYLKIDTDDGVIVSDVEKKSPGENAGIILKDIIIKVNGKKVNSVQDIEDILDEGYFKTGDQVDIVVIRNSKPIQLKLDLINPFDEK